MAFRGAAVAIEDLSGRRKSAILCTSMGAEAAAKILQRLTPDEVEMLSLEIATLPTMDRGTTSAILQEYFDAWTTVHGAAYAGGLGRHASDVNTPEGRRQYAGFRNLLTCEAHNELMTNYARLRLDKRLGRAEARLGTLQKWMAGELAG